MALNKKVVPVRYRREVMQLSLIHIFERSYLCIMLMLGVMPLLVSGTYLEWDYFWATLGVCIAIIRPMGSEKRKGNAQAYSEDTCK